MRCELAEEAEAPAARLGSGYADGLGPAVAESGRQCALINI
jgi:hypothetical protein